MTSLYNSNDLSDAIKKCKFAIDSNDILMFVQSVLDRLHTDEIKPYINKITFTHIKEDVHSGWESLSIVIETHLSGESAEVKKLDQFIKENIKELPGVPLFEYVSYDRGANGRLADILIKLHPVRGGFSAPIHQYPIYCKIPCLGNKDSDKKQPPSNKDLDKEQLYDEFEERIRAKEHLGI